MTSLTKVYVFELGFGQQGSSKGQPNGVHEVPIVSLVSALPSFFVPPSHRRGIPTGKLGSWFHEHDVHVLEQNELVESQARTHLLKRAPQLRRKHYLG